MFRLDVSGFTSCWGGGCDEVDAMGPSCTGVRDNILPDGPDIPCSWVCAANRCALSASAWAIIC